MGWPTDHCEETYTYFLFFCTVLSTSFTIIIVSFRHITNKLCRTRLPRLSRAPHIPVMLLFAFHLYSHRFCMPAHLPTSQNKRNYESSDAKDSVDWGSRQMWWHSLRFLNCISIISPHVYPLFSLKIRMLMGPHDTKLSTLITNIVYLVG